MTGSTEPYLATVGVVSGDDALSEVLAETLDDPGITLVDPAELGPGDVVVAPLVDGRPPALEDLGVTTDARLVVVSEHEDNRDGEIRRALRQGVAGFLARGDLRRALVPTVLAVAAGQSAVPLARAQDVPTPNLTMREKQVLGLVVMGLGNAEIARRLYVAESTVKSHLSAAFSKLGVRSRNHAVALILDPQSGLGAGILTIPRGRG